MDAVHRFHRRISGGGGLAGQSARLKLWQNYDILIFMLRIIKSFVYALRGLHTTWKEELNFRIEVVVAVAALSCVYFFEFTFVEASLFVFAVTLVLVLEIINTIVEDICNKIEPNEDPVIEKIKDMSASFVFLGGLGAVAVGVFVLVHHFRGLI